MKWSDVCSLFDIDSKYFVAKRTNNIVKDVYSIGSEAGSVCPLNHNDYI